MSRGERSPVRIYLCSCGRVHVETEHQRATITPEALREALRARAARGLSALAERRQAERRP